MTGRLQGNLSFIAIWVLTVVAAILTFNSDPWWMVTAGFLLLLFTLTLSIGATLEYNEVREKIEEMNAHLRKHGLL